MNLEIKQEKFSDHCKVFLLGNCNVYNVKMLKDEFLQILNNNENILINLADVHEFDTAGLQLFVSLKHSAKIKNKKIKLTSHPESVIALLDLYGLVSFFGDKIKLTPTQKQHFPFRYGIKKLPSFVY